MDQEQIRQVVVIVVPIIALVVTTFSAVITFMAFKRGPAKIIAAVGGIVYTAWPVDLIIDALFPFGYADDLSLLAILARVILSGKDRKARTA